MRKQKRPGRAAGGERRGGKGTCREAWASHILPIILAVWAERWLPPGEAGGSSSKELLNRKTGDLVLLREMEIILQSPGSFLSPFAPTLHCLFFPFQGICTGIPVSLCTHTHTPRKCARANFTHLSFHVSFWEMEACWGRWCHDLFPSVVVLIF